MHIDDIIRVIANYVPEQALPYCVEVRKSYTFELALKKTRATKVGDFTFKEGCIPRLTLNEDLNPYLFLITYLHEIAHLDVYNAFSNNIKAHGEEWKDAFRKLMHPVMHEAIFPEPLLMCLKAHMRNPAASTFSDSALTKILRQYNKGQGTILFLHQLSEGSIFCFRGKWFKKGRRRRTRVECREIRSRKYYLIPEDMPLEGAQLSLFEGI